MSKTAQALLMLMVSAIGVGSAAAQSSTSSTTLKKFEIVSVDGNRVVVKDAAGTREYTVPPDFAVTVDGKPVAVADLKPGMTGTATITTTTTVKPVKVTEVRNGEVLQATGNSVIVRSATGIRMFTAGELSKRNVTIMKDGKAVDLTSLHTGDKLTATVITEGPPTVMTQRQVQAAMSSPAAPATAATTGSAPAMASAAPASASASMAAAAPKRKLPKTASDLPLVGLIGVTLLAAGAFLTIRRRRQV